MTKMKSKKMTKSTFAIIIMAIAMVAMLAFGGTYAYFTAEAASKTSSVTTGVIHLVAGNVVTKTNETVVYDDVVLGAITYDVEDTTVDSYIFVTLTATIDEGVTFADIFGSELAVKSGWTEVTDESLDENTKVYSHKYSTTDAATTIDFLDELKVTASPNWIEGQNQPKEMGVDVTVTVSAEAIQAKGFDDAAAAYEAL